MSTSPRAIGIAGFGMEGKAVYELYKDSVEIHIFDEREVDLSDLKAVFHRGFSIPEGIDVLYKSPGIPTSKLSLQSNNTRISTLTDYVMEKIGHRAVGVTGTKGKSTVASLIHHVLNEMGEDAVLFGNIGVADLKLLDVPERIFVVEMSSYQLEHVTHAPHIAVLTNLFPEHLSHHGSFEKYREAKENIHRHQKDSDIFIDGRNVHEMHFETSLLGAHNQKNCAIAFTALRALGVSEDDIRTHIKTFTALPYRLETVGTYKGITFIDDSLATIPEATMAALNALPRVDTLIVGGEDRGIDFSTCAQVFADSHVQTFISFPETGPKMTAEVKDKTVIPVSSMEEAVNAAFQNTPTGGVVLLSNASPSFNLFKDYKDKSAQYRNWIEKLGS